MKKHIVIGVGAAVLLLLVYGGIITLVQDWQHMIEQTAKLWYWVLLLAGGFGVQVGLFSFVRDSLRKVQASATASVATSGGISAGSMAACCAHHLSDVLPLIGLAGLTAFLVKYQLLFIVFGLLSNLAGITIMLRTIRRYGLWRVAGWHWDLGWVKKAS